MTLVNSDQVAEFVSDGKKDGEFLVIILFSNMKLKEFDMKNFWMVLLAALLISPVGINSVWAEETLPVEPEAVIEETAVLNESAAEVKEEEAKKDEAKPAAVAGEVVDEETDEEFSAVDAMEDESLQTVSEQTLTDIQPAEGDVS